MDILQRTYIHVYPSVWCCVLCFSCDGVHCSHPCQHDRGTSQSARCNGRSKKYKKWHFWGCSLSETLQRIHIRFGRDDYVGGGRQYTKWHINRFRGVISAKGWNVNGLCFFIFYFLLLVHSLAPLAVKPLDRFWRVIRHNACFWVSSIPVGVRTMTSQF